MGEFHDEMEEQILCKNKQESDVDDNIINIHNGKKESIHNNVNDKSRDDVVVIAREVVAVAVGTGSVMDEGEMMRANVAAHLAIMKPLIEGFHDLIENLNM